MIFIKKVYRKFFFLQQRAIMRGYQVLKKTDRLSLIDDIKNTITRDALMPNNDSLAILKNEVDIEDHNIIIQQFLIERLLTLYFNKAVLYTIGTNKKLVYALPVSWQKILLEQGIQINKTLCTVLFWKFILVHSFYGVGEFFFQILRSFNTSVHNIYKNLSSYVYFETLLSSNLPDVSGNYQSGIISTYINRFPKAQIVDVICHSVKNKSGLVINGTPTFFIPSPIPPVKGFARITRYFFSGMGYLVMTLVDTLRGKWQTPLILREKIKALVFDLSEHPKAKQYLFHNSGWIYRPLWTYLAEKKGSRVLFYFYSVNCERFKKGGKYPDIMTNAWAITTWPQYLVWDDYQADFIHRVIQRNNTAIVVGSVSFTFGEKKLVYEGKKFIAVFDVQPMRETFYNTLGIDTEYYVPTVTNKFLDDIIHTANHYGFNVIIKRKREIGKYLHPEYRSFMERHTQSEGCIFIDPSIPAEEIIPKSEFVISMPFTSTAILAKEMGKSGIYYDPSGIIEKDDRAGHGITIINGKEELRKWIESYTQERKSV